jgi:pimeloyl-ACP methyl ester carboxylesterase
MAPPLPQLRGVRHRFLDAGGMKVHVAVAGRGDPVVLLHGWPQHWYAWRSVIPRLAEHHRVVAPDLRGFGWSEIAWQGFDKENMADDVIRLLDAMGLRRVRVVGHDWGGWIGFMLALRHPERVESLVAMSVVSPWTRPTLRNLAATPRFAYMPVLAAPFLGQRLLERHPGFVARMIRAGASRHEAFKRKDLRLYAGSLGSSTRARASSLLYRTFLLQELLPIAAGRYRRSRLTVPAVLMNGALDPVISRLSTEQDHRAGGLRVEVVPDAGHFLPEERPGYVSSRVLEFFGSADRAAAAGD